MNNAQMAARPPGREHIPIYPRGFIAIRIVQLVLALVILGLAGYGISYFPFDGNSLVLAVAVMTLVSSIYLLVVEFGAPAGYNYWAILGLDIFFVVLWLIGFALLASEVAPVFGAGTRTCSSFTGRCTTSSLLGLALTLAATQMVAAALGGVEFILYIVSLVIHSIRLHRHRKAGLHCMPLSQSPPGGPAVVPVAMYQQPYPPHHHQQQQQAMPAAYQHHQQQQQQPQQQQFYPPQGYYVPMPMPGQQPQQMPQQQQGGFYPPPQPSQSPAPPSLVPQPTGSSHTTSQRAPEQQQQPQQQQPQQQQVSQLPGN